MRTQQEVETSNDVERWTSARSEVRIWMPLPGVIRFKYFGFSEAAAVPWMAETANRMIKVGGRSPVDMFVDCWLQEGYEPGFRTGLTDWNKRIYKDIRTMPLLIRSKVAAMGITVSNLALGGLLVPFTEPQQFERAYQESVLAARRAP